MKLHPVERINQKVEDSLLSLTFHQMAAISQSHTNSIKTQSLSKILVHNNLNIIDTVLAAKLTRSKL